MEYKEAIDNDIHESMAERRKMLETVKESNYAFAEYLKKNFNGQLVDVKEQGKIEQKKTKWQRFFERLINIL